MAAGGNSHRNEVLREARKSGRCDLQHLERLQNLERLTVTCGDYRDAIISTPPEKTIVYCDIPYERTAQYRHTAFDHGAFFEWCRNSPYTVYVSSYDAPMDCVLETGHRSTLGNNSRRTVERLYCNRPEKMARLA